MSLIQSAVRSLANRFLPKDELLAEALAARSKEDVAGEARLYIRRSAPLLERTSKEYAQAVTAAEELLLSHYSASSFPQLCRSFVRKNAKPEYYLIAAIGQIIEAYNAERDITSSVSGGEAGALLANIAIEIEQAKAEKNFIKKRSILRAGVTKWLEGIDSARAAALSEMILQLP